MTSLAISLPLSIVGGLAINAAVADDGLMVVLCLMWSFVATLIGLVIAER